MSLIRIINGVYGYQRGNYMVPITSADPPIEVDDETAKDLVKAGTAEYVKPVWAKKEPEKVPEEPETERKPQTKGAAKKTRSKAQEETEPTAEGVIE